LIRILDNFLTPSYADLLEQKIGSHDQPWFYMCDSTDGEVSEILDKPPSYSFSYNIWSYEMGMIDTPLSNMMMPFIHQLMDEIGTRGLIRCRLDMTLHHPANVLHTPHTDFSIPHVTCIYYVNNSDGDTLIYNEKEDCGEFTIKKRVSPKKNRLIIFDGDQYHTGHSPVKYRNRILINTNFTFIS